MILKYLIGDATEPIKKPAIIAHVCNDCQPVGLWGSGFVIALSKKNKAPEKAYIKWSKGGATEAFQLGAVQFVQYSENVLVANMVAQHGIKQNNNIPPIRYDALERCLSSIYTYAKKFNFTVHGPRFGAERSGGSWDEIEKIIKKVMTVDTYIYTLESQKDRWPTVYENDSAVIPNNTLRGQAQTAAVLDDAGFSLSLENTQVIEPDNNQKDDNLDNFFK